MEEKLQIKPELEEYIHIAKGIAATVGKNCEVVIHDIHSPEESIVFMVGNITNRSLKAPITNLVLEAIRNNGDESEDLICYQTKTKDGKILKSSTMFIRDKQKKIVGCMCINIDMTEFYLFQKLIDKYIDFPEKLDEGVTKDECFAENVNEVIENIIKQVIDSSPVHVSLMQKEDKIEVVKELDKKGVFLVKGSIDQVANHLGVSRYTIYNYLEETRFKV